MTPLPANIEEVFEPLKKQITLLHAKWIIYRQLFGSSERRIELLNECASMCFIIIQDAILQEVEITLSKLTDPPRKNLSLKQLYKRIEAHGNSDFVRSLGKLLEDLKIKCEDIRKHRDKRLAHFDLTTAMQNSWNLLPGISRQMIEEALEVTRNFMNTIEIYYIGSTYRYEHCIMSTTDGEALISILKNGLRYKELLKNKEFFVKERGKGQWRDA
jgi:hypothetical protein